MHSRNLYALDQMASYEPSPSYPEGVVDCLPYVNRVIYTMLVLSPRAYINLLATPIKNHEEVIDKEGASELASRLRLHSIRAWKYICEIYKSMPTARELHTIIHEIAGCLEKEVRRSRTVNGSTKELRVFRTFRTSIYAVTTPRFLAGDLISKMRTILRQLPTSQGRTYHDPSHLRNLLPPELTIRPRMTRVYSDLPLPPSTREPVSNKSRS
jgi:hypothetical protein